MPFHVHLHLNLGFHFLFFREGNERKERWAHILDSSYKNGISTKSLFLFSFFVFLVIILFLVRVWNFEVWRHQACVFPKKTFWVLIFLSHFCFKNQRHVFSFLFILFSYVGALFGWWENVGKEWNFQVFWLLGIVVYSMLVLCLGVLSDCSCICS